MGPLPSELENPLFVVEIMRTLLADFRRQLILEIQSLLQEKKSPPEKQWIKSSEVRKLLGISHGTLQTLRNNGTLPFTRIGGVLYYSHADITRMMEANKPRPK